MRHSNLSVQCLRTLRLNELPPSIQHQSRAYLYGKAYGTLSNIFYTLVSLCLPNKRSWTV